MIQDCTAAELLIEAGADINTPSLFSFPITMAIELKDAKMVKLLIQKGVRLHSTNLDVFRGEPCALMFAVRNGNREIIQLLLQTDAVGYINGKNHAGRTVLHCVQELQMKDQGIGEMLIKYGANINAQDKKGFSPLHLAAHSQRVLVVQMLLMHGADQRLRNHAGKTALEIAIGKRDREIVELLGGKLKKRWYE